MLIILSLIDGEKPRTYLEHLSSRSNIPVGSYPDFIG